MEKSEFKDLFLKLTQWTIPHGKEYTLEEYLPKGFKKDNIGNYYYQIGQSETLFTGHLDTHSDKYEKVNHIINDYLISTDGTTILGGDNKLGITILISMIGDRIPGTYYFFVGEEVGCVGSRGIANFNPEFFKKFRRSVAFDRRGMGSIVVRQMGRMSCSNEFATSLAGELALSGIKWDSQSGFGYYTDTSIFMDIIPECTNISAGGFNEHHKNEWVDLNYTWSVYKAACRVNWESLPTVRKLEMRFYDISNGNNSNISDRYKKFLQTRNYNIISEIFKVIDMSKTRDITNKSGERLITYSLWLEDYDFNIILDNGKIIVDNEEITMSKLKDLILRDFSVEIIDEIETGSKKSVDNIISKFGFTNSEEMLNHLKNL